MRVKATLINFKSKVSKSCNRFVSLFLFKVKRPVFIRPLRRARHRGHVKTRSHNNNHPKKPISSYSSSLLSYLCFLSTNKKMSKTKPRSSPFSVKDDEESLKCMQSPLTPATAKKHFTSPITTPTYATRIKKSLNSRDEFQDKDVEDACRNFENYLIHLIVEEGEMDDLMDIEELLFCWKKLKSPVFIELVSRFYGELCRDLFLDE